jgi:hypothetical protein
MSNKMCIDMLKKKTSIVLQHGYYNERQRQDTMTQTIQGKTMGRWHAAHTFTQ